MPNQKDRHHLHIELTLAQYQMLTEKARQCGLTMEFKGSAIKKMYMLPMSVPGMYLCKFLILTVMLFVAVALENLALMKIGMSDLPQGTFEMGTLFRFTAYSFITSMSVLSFALLLFALPFVFTLQKLLL